VSWIVADVMTRDVVTVPPSTTYDECVRLMRMEGVGALPVVERGRALGIISMTDLVLKEHRPTVRERYERGPAARGRGEGRTAAALMTHRLVTVSPDTPLSVAVREMFQHRVNRLPVVDGEARLVGIVSRSDVLRMFLRSDVSIRKEVRNAVAGDMPFIGKGRVSANVTDGVVTLDGEVEPGTLTGVLVRLVSSVPGVVGVKNQLKVRRGKSVQVP
jgi:CBS domain-containing protein